MYLIVLCLICFLGLTHAQGQVRTVEQCVYGTLVLNCPTGSVIRIKDVLLGDSSCFGVNCCPKSTDCTHAPSPGHKSEVNRACNWQTDCRVSVERRGIPCGTFGLSANNDFERIKYECIVATTTPTSSSSSSTTSLSSSVTSTTTAALETTTLSLLVVTGTKPTVLPSDDNDNNNGTQPTTTDEDTAVVVDKSEASPHNVDDDDAAAADDGEDGVVSVIIPIIVAIIVLVVIAVIVGYCIRRRKRLAKLKDPQGFSNPEYAAMNFRHLEQSQRQTDSSDVTASPNHPPNPIYELEAAIGRLSDAPLIPENEYSDVEDVKRSGGAKSDVPAGKKAVSACSDYCVPAECGMRPGDAPSYDSPVSPAAQYQPGSPSPIYGNVDIEMQPCNAAGIYSEPKPWSEVAYESVGMRQQHPESEYVPYTANEEPRVSLHPTAANGQLNNNSVYFNMGRQQSTEVSP